ncbi:bifunctional DedA family/phosphatase PAP2 family protein [Jannaschia sp. R86511]|uniref:bifunctional DedA family/phosphatase PAP2 family protein n=1 Tax=Jannaschia sp. R86511 TaxID=3093853 RepID=UPI0036D39608
MTGIIDTILNLPGPLVYVVAGLLVFFESAAFLGLVLPGETALLLAGVIASRGNVDVVMVGVIGVVAAIAGDSVGYEVGRRLGPGARQSRLGRLIGTARWQRAEGFVTDRGGMAVLLGRWVGVLRALVPAVAGMTGMPYRRFLLWNALGGAVWAVVIVTLGYLAGNQFPRVLALLGRASGAALLLVVLLVAGALLTRWVIRHPRWWTELTGRLSSATGGAALVRPLRARVWRLSVRAGDVPAFAAVVMVTVAGVSALAVAFAHLLDNVLDGDGVTTVDRPVLAWLAARRDDEFSLFMEAVTWLGGPVGLPLLAGAAVGTLAVRTRSWAPLALGAVTAAGSVAITSAGKYVVGRSRPPLDLAVVDQAGYAFPSGHSLNSLALLGLVGVLLARSVVTWRWRVTWVAVCAGLVLLIGFSRLYLGVHWLTDVLGAWLLAAMWLSLVLTGWRWTGLRAREHAPPGPPPEPSAPSGGGRADAEGVMVAP